MLGVKVEITRYVDDEPQPGIVECRFFDAWGSQHLFIEKVPVVTLKSLDDSSSYPQPAIIACQILDRREIDGREILKIDTETPWHIESISGASFFDVSPDQLIEFD